MLDWLLADAWTDSWQPEAQPGSALFLFELHPLRDGCWKRAKCRTHLRI